MQEQTSHCLGTQRWDDLQLKGLGILQQPGGFCFGVDAVLLANAVTLKEPFKGADLGTGTGIIPILLCAKSAQGTVEAVEIQPEVADMARRSVGLNALQERVRVHTLGVEQIREKRLLEPHSLDFVTCNPPYTHGRGLVNASWEKRVSRHGGASDLEDFIAAAAHLLRFNGHLYMVNRPNRLTDMIVLGRKHCVELKQLRMVHSFAHSAPKLVLAKFTYQAKSELKVLPPLVLYEAPGIKSEEHLLIYQSPKGGRSFG